MSKIIPDTGSDPVNTNKNSNGKKTYSEEQAKRQKQTMRVFGTMLCIPFLIIGILMLLYFPVIGALILILTAVIFYMSRR